MVVAAARRRGRRPAPEERFASAAGFTFAPDDLCVGLDASQADVSITLAVHFDAEARSGRARCVAGGLVEADGKRSQRMASAG